mmetsp:Transcript_65874/g.204051  ORF Transcript_65874/g.204051 Transcript_65874/m.204051 type:complete len:509 (+) Transcript_65874:93-1619(+)
MTTPGSVHGQASVAPDAIIISGPDTYVPQITRLYGGYKRTRDLYGRATYQKDPDQGDPGLWDAYVYWSAADSKWCAGARLGAAIGELHKQDPSAADAVLVYQVAPAGSEHPCLHGSWVANLYGSGARYQADHALKFEALALPREAADPAGRLHVCARKFVDYEFPPKTTSIEGGVPPLHPARSWGRSAEAAAWLPATLLAGQPAGPLFPAPGRPPCDWLAEVPPEVGGIYPILAAVQEYPGHLEALFSPSPEMTQLGKCAVRLFDVLRSEWRRITVDEFVPVVHTADGVPAPWLGGHLKSLWALLLEKALAKLCGGYEALRRSESGLILAALTGQAAGLTRWQRENGWWSLWSFLLPEQQHEPMAATSVLGRSTATPSSVAATAAPTLHRRVLSVRPLRGALGRIGGGAQREQRHAARAAERQRGWRRAGARLLPAWLRRDRGGAGGQRSPPGAAAEHMGARAAVEGLLVGRSLGVAGFPRGPTAPPPARAPGCGALLDGLAGLLQGV